MLFERLRIEAMLLGEDPLGESLGGFPRVS